MKFSQSPTIRTLNKPSVLTFAFLAIAFFLQTVQAVPSGIDHHPWDELLQKYVNEQGLVDYEGWHNSSQDRQKLEAYVQQFSSTDSPPAEGDNEIAALINAYNAFTIHFIISNFPTESIRKLDAPFDGKRHRMEGQLISVDTIEHELLRPRIGWKVHSVVVCAARSCPPLLNHAYFAEDWETKMQERYRTWLAREDLNRISPQKKRVDVSKIFDWYSEDFRGDNTVKSILVRFGPNAQQAFLESGDYRLGYLDYHWGLNAQSNLGEDYTHSFWRSLF